ncbi:MAG: hypothetical protein IJA10_03545 [Lachnospiraceae bacterium]|nr:hypothetical protein [Lachnospiraceae bacterium]
MENIILSLLLLKSMTIYEMRVFIQQNLSTVCSDSLGSLQSAIKKLMNKNHIVLREYLENGVVKKQYSITEEGITQFKDWIGTPMNLQKIKNMEEGKFFFLGMAPKETRISSIQGYIESLRIEYEKLSQIQAYEQSFKENVIEKNVERIQKETALSRYLLEVSGESTLEEVIQNIYDYQIYVLEYGLKRLQDDIDFYEGILKKELERED